MPERTSHRHTHTHVYTHVCTHAWYRRTPTSLREKSDKLKSKAPSERRRIDAVGTSAIQRGRALLLRTNTERKLEAVTTRAITS